MIRKKYGSDGEIVGSGSTVGVFESRQIENGGEDGTTNRNRTGAGIGAKGAPIEKPKSAAADAGLDEDAKAQL
jgi:hypothetical protein